MAARSLRIGIDARVLAEPAPMGVARYLAGLLRALAEQASQHDYILYLCRNALPELPFEKRPFMQRVLGHNPLTASPLVWQQCVLPWAVRKDKIDVLFSPYYCGPLLTSVPQIVCLHDISFVLFPKEFPSWIHFKPKLLAYPSSRRATKVITVSEFSRQEILRVYGLRQEKVQVVSPGSERPSCRPERLQAGMRRNRIPARFFLFAGSLLPRRQVKCVLQALSKVSSECHFVVVGERDAQRQRALQEFAQTWNVADRVHILGHISDEHLEDLYLRTLALISPSTYEGFGLPVLEAMIRGVPVVAWDIPIMREVVGEAGLLIKSGDIGALAGAMRAIATSQRQRALLKQKGYAQAKKFSWESAAAHFIEILNETTARGQNLAHNV